MDFTKILSINVNTVVGKLILINIVVYIVLAVTGVVFFILYELYTDAFFSLFFLIKPGSGYSILYIIHFVFDIPILLVGLDILLYGYWWELLTSMFIHANILHLGFNMFALKVLGEPLEKLVGKLRLLVVFLLSGIVGNVLTVLTNPTTISLGASGGIFGIAATISFIEYKLFKYTRSLKWLLLVFLISSLPLAGGVPNIIAHFGGLVTGATLGLIYASKLRETYGNIEDYYY